MELAIVAPIMFATGLIGSLVLARLVEDVTGRPFAPESRPSLAFLSVFVIGLAVGVLFFVGRAISLSIVDSVDTVRLMFLFLIWLSFVAGLATAAYFAARRRA